MRFSAAGALVFGLAIPVLLSPLGGCAHGSGYRVARFLFDGVPVPPEQREGQGPEEEGSRLPGPPPEPARPQGQGVQPSFAHAPFARGDCASCHDAQASHRLVQDSPGLCTRCHSGVLTGKKVVHVPAEADCLICHVPHRSAVPKLLSGPVQEVCLACHDRGELEKVHGEILDCTSCHNPHESDDASLLEFK